MKHYSAEVKEKQAEAPPGRRKRSEQYEKPDRDRTEHPQKTSKFVPFVDVSQTWNDA